MKDFINNIEHIIRNKKNYQAWLPFVFLIQQKLMNLLT